MTTFQVLLPVTHHALQVTSSPAGSETRLEMLVLRYVHHVGTTDVAHVARTFGLRHRVALGVALSLWREGSLLVDLHRGDMRVTPEVAGLCESGELEVLNERRRRIDEQEVVLEPISGFVGLFKDTIRPAKGAGASIAPAAAVPTDITAVMRKDLLAVVLRAQRSSDSEERLDRRIVEVGLSSPMAREISPSGARFLPVEVSASAGDDEEDIRIRVLADGSRMTAPQRIRVETFLLDLVDDRPDERLVSTIRSNARGPLIAPPTIAERIDTMRQQCSGSVTSVLPDQIQSQHDQLVDQAIALDRDLSDRDRSAACPLELLASASQIRATSTELIRGARDQVVIASPWIRRTALNTAFDDLRDALDRNVDVVILWGIADGEVLDADVMNMFANLSGPARETQGRLLVARRSARTHAKLVIQDDKAMLLYSHNLLSSDDGRTEFGLLLSDTGGTSPHVLGEVLRWVQNAYPNYQQARTFLLQDDPPPVTPAIELPTPPPAEGADQERHAWQRSWQSFIDRTERRHRDVGVHVQGLVENQRHRQMLTAALQEADRRVLATGQRLTAQSINQAMLGEFRRYLERTSHGVLVLVHESNEEADDEVRAALTALAEEFPGRFVAQAADQWHAKLLLWDDESVISSFNFLSFEGGYRNRGSRMRSELGVQVSGRPFADQLFSAVLDAAPVSGLNDAPAPPAADDAPLRGLADPADWKHIRILLGLDPRDVRRAFLARVSEDRRNAVVEALSSDGEYDDLAGQLAAAALADGSSSQQWEHSLGMDAWERGDFLLAHAILPGDVSEPSAPLRTIASALESPSIATAIAAFDPNDFRPREHDALLITGIWALLNGHPEALSLVDRDDQALPELRRAAMDYFERSGGRPAPWEDLHAHDRELERAERVEAIRSTILESLDQFERTNSLNYREGRRLQQYWRADDSSFNRLRQILADSTSASSWLHEWGEDAASFLASNCGAGATGEIDLGRQPGLQKRLDRLLGQIRDYEHFQSSGEHLDGLNEIVDRLRTALQREATESEEPSDPDPADVVVRRCRDLLFGGHA
ncbi:MAG: hypothetical protein GY798_21055 [Hyphomicrobiales bacterium]|nr:hypothetical protein [Hyphomicrobiales bacterium]